MKKNLFVLVAAGLVMVSCNKRGCTDVKASNYNSEATKDDESCTYTSDLTLWYDQATSISLGQSGVTTIKVFVGEVESLQHPVGDYEVIEPDCGAAGTMTVTKNLNTKKTGTIAWELKDQNDVSLFNGTWNAIGGECTTIEVDP